MSNNFLTTKDVLKKVKISRNTLFLWLRKGRVPEVIRDRNGHRLFTEKDVRNIIEFKNTKISPENLKK
ncbi:MAG: helix-turn-helix domain-containing protein [Candidatus Omnitrophota bacterium]